MFAKPPFIFLAALVAASSAAAARAEETHGRGQVPDKARTSADAKAHAGRAETIGWAFERKDGGRSFAFTGADWHTNWKAEGQRRLVVNGILWSAKVGIPEGGAPVAFAAEDIAKNWDDKPKPAPKVTAAPAAKEAK